VRRGAADETVAGNPLAAGIAGVAAAGLPLSPYTTRISTGPVPARLPARSRASAKTR
jgi:hypothetical protein